MKVIDVIFSLICGRVIALLLSDILRELGISVTIYEHLVIWLAFPFFSLFCLWIASLIGRKFLFVFQGAKFLLVGAFATVVDLKFFEFLLAAITLNPIVSKSLSFIGATLIKFWGNKYWAFQKHEKENLKKEVIQFFTITLGGLVIDVVVFYFCYSVFGPQFGIPPAIWTKVSVIFAGLVAAVWNFTGYKFFVFKK